MGLLLPTGSSGGSRATLSTCGIKHGYRLGAGNLRLDHLVINSIAERECEGDELPPETIRSVLQAGQECAWGKACQRLMEVKVADNPDVEALQKLFPEASPIAIPAGHTFAKEPAGISRKVIREAIKSFPPLAAAGP